MSRPPDTNPARDAPSADWLDAFARQTRELLAATDAAGRIEWCNLAFETALDLGIGTHLLSLAPPGLTPGSTHAALRSALASGRTEPAPLILQPPGGVAVRVSALATLSGASRLWTLRVIGNDEATRAPDRPPPRETTAADAADLRAETLAKTLESAARAAQIGIWSTDAKQLEAEWNAQMYALFDTIANARPPSMREWLERCVHPDDRDRTAREALEYMRGGAGAVELEFRSLRRNGQVRWMVLRADFDECGSHGGRIFGIAMDVTQRHEAQAALHAASERAALIAQHAGIGTWESRGDDDRAHWDAQMWHLRGLPPRAGSPSRAERLASVHPDDRAGLIDSQPELAHGPESTSAEFRVRLPDGSHRWLASRSAALLDARGAVIGRVGVNWDVTEAHAVAQARQQALLAERESRAKSRFLARMSHELRTPLNAVLGFTQLLQLEARQPVSDTETAMRSARLDHIRAAGEHLLMLIDDALDLSSLQAGSQPLELEPVGLALAVSRALPLVSPLAAQNGIGIQVGALPEAVIADPIRLQQVLLKLLTNAITYNRRGGRVEVDSTARQGRVQLRVRDSGHGIEPDQLALLFEPFNRPAAAGDVAAGSGIGLTIVKALVENMGGRIAVTSQPGVGTEFELTLLPSSLDDTAVRAAEARLLPTAAETRLLPTAAEARLLPTAAEARPSTAAAHAPPPGRSAQLLYIEDNEVNVLLVQELVRQLPGLRLRAEGTGAAGVARARSLQPDMILVDMQLPDFDGHEVLRRLRGDPATAAIPCIALSANALPEEIERALGAGFVAYWTKPIRFQAFVDALALRFPLTGITPAAPPGPAV